MRPPTTVTFLTCLMHLSLAYFDVFWYSAVVGIVLVVLIPLLRKSSAEKGAHVAAE